MKTRNKLNLPINFCTSGNFLNLKKVKFIPLDNPPKIKNSKHQLIKLHTKNSTSNLSEIHNITKDEISKKDELILKLQQRIKFLEKKIKLLEKSASKPKNRSRNISLNNGLLLKTEKSTINNINEHNHTSLNSLTNKTKHKTIIPLDKQLIKTKLTKNKKNIFELIDITKIKFNKKNQNSFKNRNNSFNFVNNNTNTNNSNSLSNYTTYNYTTNNSCTGSELKPRKKSVKLNLHCGKINSLHNLLYSMSSNKNSKNKISGEKNRVTRKINAINAIPKKVRVNQNASLKIMMSSTNYTNYSNNISNSFKEETNVNTNTNNNGMTNNTSFIEIQNKLENIKNRTKNLFEVFSKMNSNLAQNQNLNDNMKNKKFPYNIRISKLEKIKK
jgi:hypothetical protein